MRDCVFYFPQRCVHTMGKLEPIEKMLYFTSQAINTMHRTSLKINSITDALIITYRIFSEQIFLRVMRLDTNFLWLFLWLIYVTLYLCWLMEKVYWDDAISDGCHRYISIWVVRNVLYPPAEIVDPVTHLRWIFLQE